jgi:hypothetical protein
MVTIDYGFTRRSVRFPAGTRTAGTPRTRMLVGPESATSPRSQPGAGRERRGARPGDGTFRNSGADTSGGGRADQFASALDAADDGERLRRRMQLKTLLFGMGEAFRVLVQRRGESEGKA